MVSYIGYGKVTMRCIYCGAATSVTNSRTQKRLLGVWRRRHCKACDAHFTTKETIDYDTAFTYRHASTMQAFCRDQIYSDVLDCLRHRKTKRSDATELTETIIRTLIDTTTTAVIDRPLILETCHSILGRFDKVAAIQYVALHP